MASSLGDQVLSWQSAPPQAEPQTTLVSFSLQPAPEQALPHVPVAGSSQSSVAHMTPHVAVCPPGTVVVPQTTVVAHALAVGVSRPPLTRRVPQISCRLHPAVDG